MKGKNGAILSGIALIDLIIWLVLPVLSFVFLVPLFNINGWNLAMNFNQIMLIPAALILLMIVCPLFNNRNLMIVVGVLQVICSVLVIIFRKDILLSGNLNWLYASAKLLIDQLATMTGANITSANLNSFMDTVVTNFLQLGIGYIIHAVLTLAYLLLAALVPVGTEAKNTSGHTGGSSTRANIDGMPMSRGNDKLKTGYKHRT